MIHEGETLGHFVLTSASDVARPSLEQRRVAVLMADQVASVPRETSPVIRRWHANDLYAAVPVGDQMALMLVLAVEGRRR